MTSSIGVADEIPPRNEITPSSKHGPAYLLCQSLSTAFKEQEVFVSASQELHLHIEMNLSDVLIAAAKVNRQFRHHAPNHTHMRSMTIRDTCDGFEGLCMCTFSSKPLVQSVTIENVMCACKIFRHAVKYCPQLTTIRLRKCDVFGCLLLANLNHISELDLRGCDKLKDCLLSCITHKLPQLKRLNLAYCEKLTDEGIVAIASLENLEALDLTGIYNITDRAMTTLISAQFLSLQELYFDGEDLFLTDSTYRAVAHCEKLIKLELTFARKMMDESLTGLMSLKELQTLKITCNDEVTSKGFNMFFANSNFTKLVSLSLISCENLDDNAVLALSESCPHLRKLVLDCCTGLEKTWLESIMSHCKFLEHISFKAVYLCKDICLLLIPKLLPRLKFLYLQLHYSISDKVIKKLMTLMPNLVIKNELDEVVTAEDLYDSD